MRATSKVYSILSPVERRRTASLIALMAIGMVLETLGIGLIIPAIALLTQPDIESKYPRVRPVLNLVGSPAQGRLAIYGMLAVVAVYLVRSAFLGFLVWRQSMFAFGVQAGLSQRLFTMYLRQPYTFHLQRNSAQLIRNAITEVYQYTFNILLPSLLVLTEAFALIGVAGMLVVVEPLGAIIIGVSLGLASWAFYRMTRARVTQWGEARQFHEGMRLQHLQQGLAGAKVVKLLGREEVFISRYHEHNAKAARVAGLQTTFLQFPRLWIEFLGVAGLALLVITMIGRGRDTASIVPAIALFAAAAFRLLPSVNRVMGAVQSLRYGLPVIDVLYGELQADVPAAADRGRRARPPEHTIELARVSFSYEGAAQPALQDVSLVLQRGETVGVIGASGSGKSTLVDLLLGLLVPNAGKVRVDGRDIRQDLREWQDQIGYVPQSVYLTDDTVRRNVAFGLADPEIDDNAVRRSLQAAQLEEFVASLPYGMETSVGERGVRLSGGQLQRIGIARALYHDPPVLVLDEATSALDAVTEHELMQAVSALHGKKTILIIAHRLTTVTNCDRIYRLERGSIVAVGTVSEMAPSVQSDPAIRTLASQP